MKLKQAILASAWEAKRRRSSSSQSRVAKKLSHMALSHGSGFAGPRAGSGVADRAHRGPHAGVLATPAERERGVLAALITVVDDIARPTLADRHVEGVQHQFGAQMVGHRPADDLAAPGVEHHRE